MEDEIKFCPTCGFEGNDITCPVCNIQMESLEAEVEKIGKAENKKSELFDDVSLENEQEKEEKEEKEENVLPEDPNL